ncbi:ABC transporter ATP-binding protein [uncultured Sutterella sp.]|uniref:dipeptide ABC transporter ATP-binding protein n=1 Tax=uncultured Sutterella sp. TaxID=286133 RepID=UPI0026008BB9|nr:ABC transporter ATP-binding protein [uncultured Sutterella sp.]
MSDPHDPAAAPAPQGGALLSIRGLRVAFSGVEVLHGVDIDLKRGEILALIGESGSGKSVLARSVMGLAGSRSTTTGSIRFEGRELAGAPEEALHALRGAEVSMIVQDAMAALNPMRTIGEQLMETIVYRHPDYRNRASEGVLFEKKAELTKLAVEFLRQVGITAPEKRILSYPHQLSGGMRQRVLIALALVGAPKLLLADEPTTALDVVVQREILSLLRDLVRARGMSMLLVTHDLHLARDVADRVSVMYAGSLLEDGPCAKVIPNPAHPYTEGLLNAMPDMESPRGSLKPIEGEVPAPSELGAGCPFASRCVLAAPECRRTMPPMHDVDPGWRSRCLLAHTRSADLEKLEEIAAAAPEALGSVKIEAEIDRRGFGGVQRSEFPVIVDARIKKHCYYARRGFFGRRTPWNVLEDVDLQINRGEVLGLVGESGCGKSTLARLMLGLTRPTDGSVRFRNAEYPEPRTVEWRAQRAAAQMIYQDPFSCFDERMTVLDQVAEPLEIHEGLSHREACRRALEVLRAVGLPEHHAGKLPGVMSGGQLQRAAIARAVALRPALLVCDEPVASLDVSIQAQVLALLNRLKATTHMSMLFVSHNLNVVRYLCDRAAVMYLGRIVETGPVDEVFHHPKHPYTRLLLASTPGAADQVIRFYPKGVMPSPMDRPAGCVFANRCPVAAERCRRDVPELEPVADGHACACFVKHSFLTDEAPAPTHAEER